MSAFRNISLSTIRSQIGGFRQVPSSGSVTAQPRPLVTDDHVLIRVPSPAIGEIARLKDNHERKGKIVFIVKNKKKLWCDKTTALNAQDENVYSRNV